MYRKDWESEQDKRKRSAEEPSRGGSATRAVLATVGQQNVFTEGQRSPQPSISSSSSSQRHRERELPSIDHVRSKQQLAAEPENVGGQPATVNSTAAPSEASASAASSRRSSSHTEPTNSRHPSLGDWQPLPARPAPSMEAASIPAAKQAARSQSVGGTSSRASSRAAGGGAETPENGSRAPSASGSRTPQPGRMRGVVSDGAYTPEMGNRAPSGSRTPDLRVNTTGQVVPPLTSAQLESASRKLEHLDDRPPSANGIRSGWDAEENLSGRGGAQPNSPVSPSTPSGTRDSKNKRPVRQFSDDKSRPSGSSRPPSNSGQRPGASSSKDNSGVQSSPSSARTQSRVTNPRSSLKNGSRDDSFLSTISESTRSSDSTSTDRDSKINVVDGSQIEVYSATASKSSDNRLHVDVLKDFCAMFKQVGEKEAELMQLHLRNHSFDKPLETQRRTIPLIMSAFHDEQKSFITVQGAAQCGKTSALALGILGAVGVDMPGIRAIALSTGPVREFKKCFDICSEVHPIKISCFESNKRRVSFEGVDPDPSEALYGANITEDMQRLTSELTAGAPGVIFGHPGRVLPLLREAPAWGVDLSNVQVLALDDAEEAICQGLIDEVCEVCTILRHFSKQRLRHIILSHFLSNEAKSMVRCLRTSLVRQENLFGIRAHRTQARAKAVNHYYAVAPRARWPAMLAVLHHALSLPSGIIFDDESADARAHTRVALRSLGVTASVWNALQEQKSGARAAARDSDANNQKGPAFHLMPSDLVVLKVDLPQVRCVLHFEVPRRELSIYGLRLMCLEQQEVKKSTRKTTGITGSKSLSVLFVEEAEIVRELEKTFHIRMHEVPTDMLPN